MNVFTATGNLGKDIDIRETTSGTLVGSFSVGVKSGWGDRASTLWVRCTLWGKQAEALADYLKKGTPVAISGELSTSEYETNDGEKRFSVECNVGKVTLLGNKKESPNGDSEPAKAGAVADYDDDIPFMRLGNEYAF